jgi:hypothetical protein
MCLEKVDFVAVIVGNLHGESTFTEETLQSAGDCGISIVIPFDCRGRLMLCIFGNDNSSYSFFEDGTRKSINETT